MQTQLRFAGADSSSLFFPRLRSFVQKHHEGVKSSLAPLLPFFMPSACLLLHPSVEIITTIKTNKKQKQLDRLQVPSGRCPRLRYTHKFNWTEVVGGCKVIQPERRTRQYMRRGRRRRKKYVEEMKMRHPRKQFGGCCHVE